MTEMSSFHNQLSDSNQKAIGSSSSINEPEPSSFSDANVAARRSPTLNVEEEVILAGSSPERRAGGKRAFKEIRHPVYRCVRQRNDKWVSEVREPNRRSRIWLGTYPTAEMAARAHDVAALALRGEQACLNFADSAWRLPVPNSKDQFDIRRAAAEAAETFRPPEFGGVSTSTCDDDNNNKENNENERVAIDTENKDENIFLEIDMENKNEVFYDEEAIFNMPGLLTSMAEGLLLSPPRYYLDNTNWPGTDDLESESIFSLWS